MYDSSVDEEMEHDNLHRWNLFCDALKCPRNELHLMCHRNPEEVANPGKWPKIIDASRDDVQPDFACFISDFQIKALAQSTSIGIDNNQSCPYFTGSGRGIHITGLFRGIFLSHFITGSILDYVIVRFQVVQWWFYSDAQQREATPSQNSRAYLAAVDQNL